MGELLPLEGIEVLYFSSAGPGPFCTMILGDLGADVIKIETPPQTPSRRVGRKISKQDALYQAIDRNKRSIGLNLKSEKSRHIYYQLAERADVIVEGWRPGVAKRLAVDYETIAKINPRIVYCAITGYGQDGPYRDLPGHDINFISIGGALSLIGDKDSQPTIPLNLIADMGGGGMHAVVGILSALIVREKTGKGQYIDISLTDSVISLLVYMATNYFRSGAEIKRGETLLGGGYSYYNIYKTKDGKYITFGAIEPYLWADVCRALGREEFIPFHVEADHGIRKAEDKKWEEISSNLKQLFLTKTRDEWFEILSKKNLAIAKVLSLDEVFRDPQVLHRQMVVELEHPTEGKVKQIGIPIKLSDTPGKIRRLPPVLGEHTEEILTEIGYSKQSIAELRQEKAIA